MNDFRVWLSQELKQRGLSQRELGRRAGVSRQLVVRVLSGGMPASADFCIKVAIALDTSPVAALKLAGHLPADVSADDRLTVADTTLSEVIAIAQTLPPKQRDLLLEFARFLQSRTNVP